MKAGGDALSHTLRGKMTMATGISTDGLSGLASHLVAADGEITRWTRCLASQWPTKNSAESGLAMTVNHMFASSLVAASR